MEDCILFETIKRAFTFQEAKVFKQRVNTTPKHKTLNLSKRQNKQETKQ